MGPTNGQDGKGHSRAYKPRRDASVTLIGLFAVIALAVGLLNTFLIVRYLLVQQEFMEQALKELKQL